MSEKKKGRESDREKDNPHLTLARLFDAKYKNSTIKVRKSLIEMPFFPTDEFIFHISLLYI